MKQITVNKIFIITDLHFGVRANNLEWLEIQENYYKNWFIPLLEKNKTKSDVLFILGDIFDNRQNINVIVMNKVLEIFELLSKIIPIYIIIGNHDIAKKSINDINSLKIFKYLPNITIFETPEVILINNQKKLLLMPWLPNIEEERNCLLSNKHVNYVFCHTGIEGFKFNKSIKIEEGLDKTLLETFDRVITGHIHYRQNNNKILFPGCPYQLTRGDMNNDKGVYIFDPMENDYTFIKNDYSPIFIKLNLKEILEMPLEEYLHVIKNNFVDIVINNEFLMNFPLEKLIDISIGYRKIQTIANSEETFTDIDDENLDEFNILKLAKKLIDELNYPEKIKSVAYDKIQDLFIRSQNIGDE